MKRYIQNIHVSAVTKLLSLTVGIIALSAISCSDDFEIPAPPSGTSIADLAAENADLDLLTAALSKTGLVAALDNPNDGQFTLFAPSDVAFLAYLQTVYTPASVPDEATALTKIAELTNTSSPLNIATLVSRLNYHIVSSEITSSQITGAQTFSTLQGARLSLSNQSGIFLVNGNIGSNGATIIATDLNASNGIVHVVNNVMNPLSSSSNVLSKFNMTISYSTAPPTLIGGLETGGDANNSDFDIMAYAIRKSNYALTLVPNITPLPEFTVFAPTDLAMRTYITSLDPSVTNEAQAIAYLKNKSESEVADLVKYHVVSGRYLSTDLAHGLTLNTQLTGKSFNVNVAGPDTFLSDANAAAADPRITLFNNSIYGNGVAHTINGVLLPN